MKTIEERAQEYAPDAFDADLILPAREGYIVKVQRAAYITGATEQREIDIEKALSFLRYYGEGDFSCREEFEANYRKALAE